MSRHSATRHVVAGEGEPRERGRWRQDAVIGARRGRARDRERDEMRIATTMTTRFDLNARRMDECGDDDCARARERETDGDDERIRT
jgi:hypothetical protein